MQENANGSSSYVDLALFERTLPPFKEGLRAREKLESGETLSRSEQTSLRIAVTNGDKAYQDVCSSCEWIVSRAVRDEMHRPRSFHTMLDEEDLHQAGLEAVWKMMKSADLSRMQGSAVNYLMQWVSTNVHRAALREESGFGMSSGKIDMMRKIAAIRGRLSKKLGHEATDEEVFDYVQSGGGTVRTVYGRSDGSSKSSKPNRGITMELIREQASINDGTSMRYAVTDPVIIDVETARIVSDDVFEDMCETGDGTDALLSDLNADRVVVSTAPASARISVGTAVSRDGNSGKKRKNRKIMHVHQDALASGSPTRMFWRGWMFRVGINEKYWDQIAILTGIYDDVPDGYTAKKSSKLLSEFYILMSSRYGMLDDWSRAWADRNGSGRWDVFKNIDLENDVNPLSVDENGKRVLSMILDDDVLKTGQWRGQPVDYSASESSASSTLIDADISRNARNATDSDHDEGRVDMDDDILSNDAILIDDENDDSVVKSNAKGKNSKINA